MEVKRLSLVKPGLETPYHIDFDWWQQTDRNWRIYLRDYLCSDHQEAYVDVDPELQVDWIDPETAEVTKVDGLQNILISHCAKQDTFISHRTTLVDSNFRIFLSNGNVPLSAKELSVEMGRDPNLILRTISGKRVYKGIRPILE